MRLESLKAWPELQYAQWKPTYESLHRWSQVIGKIRVSKSPWLNHSWGSALYVTERGLYTSVLHEPGFSFGILLDLVSHELAVSRSDGRALRFPLKAEPVAAFHGRCMDCLGQLGIPHPDHGAPNELPDATPFTEDHTPRQYDPEPAGRFFRVLLQCDKVMKEFRSRFLGKCSPVHFFWGSFDLAVTRFSGRRAPEHPGGIPHLPDLVTREAYSHEVSSCGFWPGNEMFPEAAFYSYAYPAPEGFAGASLPDEAFFEPKLREFVLPYDKVRAAPDPDRLLLEFFQNTYDAAADLGRWDRPLLEQSPYLSELQAMHRQQRAERPAA